ncbi:MAG: hypothetical protein RLZZ511_833 [Cyanobacteriota bacterium]
MKNDFLDLKLNYWPPYRWAMLGLTLLMPVVGMLLRFSPVLPEWLRNITGNIAYETLWIVLFLTIQPRLKPHSVAIGICLMTFGLEFLQLVQHPILVAARRTLPGRLILGNGFAWFDFPQYVLGSFVGWLIVLGVRRLVIAP